jgi:hypothetical protein
MPSRGYMLWLEFEITLHLYLSISKTIKLSFTKTFRKMKWHDSAAWFSNSDGVLAVAAFRSHGRCFHRDLLSMLPLPLAAWLMRGGQRGDFLDERMQKLWYKYLSNIQQSQIMQKTQNTTSIIRIYHYAFGNDIHPLLLIARGAAPCAIAWYYDGPLAGSVCRDDMGPRLPGFSLWYSSIAMTCYGKWRNMIISRDTSSN